MYRAVDKEGNTVDFLLTKRRNKLAAHKFLVKAISYNGCPKVINIDKSGANKEAIRTYNRRCLKKIKIRQNKNLNNRVEADHRFIKWRTALMLGFKNFESASRTLNGIEMIRMIKKEQVSFPSTSFYKTFLFSGWITGSFKQHFWTYFIRCDKASCNRFINLISSMHPQTDLFYLNFRFMQF